MNLILLEDPDTKCRWPADDPRTRHVRKILRAGVGGTLKVGAIEGPLGTATIVADDNDGITIEIEWGETPSPLRPLQLMVGLPRPQAARRILRESVSIGVARIDFFRSDRGETSYASSQLWQTDEWQRRLREAAEVAATTRLPVIAHHHNLLTCLTALPESNAARIALDLQTTTQALGTANIGQDGAVLVIGSERGWSDDEREHLRRHAFAVAHLGSRIMRTDTACLAAASIVSARAGWI